MPLFAVLDSQNAFIRFAQTDSDLATLFANTSNPTLLDPEVLSAAGVVPVVGSTVPTTAPDPIAVPPIYEWHTSGSYNASSNVWEVSGEWLPREADAIQNDRRARRRALLAACDWTALPDAPLSDTARDAWRSYRQALRDITAQPTTQPTVWPTPPA